MPLGVRSNSSSNIITASWFNDIRDLLTGVMLDQEVSVKNVLSLSAIGASPASAPTAALAAGTSLGVGLYKYAYTYAMPDGESTISPVTSITTTTGNQVVNLSGITVGPTGTTKRNIYRTQAGQGYYLFVASINDNTTTTYSDTTPDASLGVNAPTNSTLGGSLAIKDSTGATRLQIANDGTLVTPAGNYSSVSGSVGGSASLLLPMWGQGFKIGWVQLVSYNSVNNALFQFPPASRMARGVFYIGNFGSNTPTVQFQLGGSAQNIVVITALASGGGTVATQTAAHQNSLGTIGVSIDQIQISGTSGVAINSGILFVGV